MEIGQIFNNKKFFLKFNDLRFSLKPKGNIRDKSKEEYEEELKPYKLASEILFRAGFAYHKLEEMKYLNEACLLQYNELKQKLTLNCKRFILGSSLVNDYLYQFMPFLNTLFILQDRIMLIFSKTLNINFVPPKKKENESEKKYKRRLKDFKKALLSFPTYATNKFNILSKFPPKIQTIVKKYWKDNAQLIRRYRNLDQHIYNLLLHTYFDTEKEKLVVILPDNPEVDEKNLKYTNNIAYGFLKNSFRAFHFFVEKMANELNFKSKEHLPESPDLSIIDLEKITDFSTICVFIFNKNVIETCKGEGFPCKISLKEFTLI